MLRRSPTRPTAVGLDVTTVRTEAEALPFEDESFDLVLGHAVLHHIPDLEARLLRVLPGPPPRRHRSSSAASPRATATARRRSEARGARRRAALAPAHRRRRTPGRRPTTTAGGDHGLEGEVDVHAFTPGDLARCSTTPASPRQVRGEELLANVYGWVLRSLEATAEPDRPVRAGAPSPSAATWRCSGSTRRCSSRACPRSSSTTSCSPRASRASEDGNPLRGDRRTIDGRLTGGPHDGHRAAHAKGILCEGSFKATPRAGELSRAEHLNGDEVRVTARFSNGSGNPGLPDNARTEGRGLAVKFHISGDRGTDSVTLTIPVFFVRTPEDFLEFTRARKPDPETGQPDMEKLGAMLAEHPETAEAIQLILPTFTPPVSYATCAYNSLHAFCLVNPEEKATWVRRAGSLRPASRCCPRRRSTTPADHLQPELRERIGGEPVRFRLVAILAEEGDTLEDPTQAWPEERERVELGTLELTTLAAEEDPASPIVFDPMNLHDGVVPSDDRILHARSHAYSVSIERRLAANG